MYPIRRPARHRVGSAIPTFEGHGDAVWSVAFAGLPEGWVAFTPDGRYRLGGETAGAFWHSIGLCRFEPGELDPYLPKPLRVPDGEPLVQWE